MYSGLLKTSMMKHFTEIVSNINLKLLTILAKRSSSDYASVGSYNTVLKVQMEISP